MDKAEIGPLKGVPLTQENINDLSTAVGKIQKIFDSVIVATPSGDARNLVTEINIHLMAAQNGIGKLEVMKDAVR